MTKSLLCLNLEMIYILTTGAAIDPTVDKAATGAITFGKPPAS